MIQKKLTLGMHQTKWVITFGILCLAACSKNEPSAQPTTAGNVVTTPTAAAVTNTEAPKIQCKKGKDARSLEVTKKDSGYLLDYEKFGKVTVFSKSPVGLNQCMEEEKKIRTKLEHSGFVCT
jgi:hypothetical protein